jgi:aspartate/glutamate racemase
VTPAAGLGPAARTLEEPVVEAPVRRYARWQDAVRGITDYQAALREAAAWRRARGLAVTDQDQPEEAFCLFPAQPDGPPLLIVGGMGPLAGASAFGQACARFRNSRIVVLHQACSVPDRSRIILREGRPDTVACREMAGRLASHVRRAAELVPSSAGPARCLVACNSSHYFWRFLVDELQRTAAEPGEVEMVSLVESSVEALGARSCGRTLLLATEGARVGRVFSAPCRASGIDFDEPSRPLNQLLMRVIYEGVKALDERRAVELGDQFFRAVLRSGQDYECVLAGCTEVPLAVNLLRQRGSAPVRDFLSRVQLLDPLEETLSHA